MDAEQHKKNMMDITDRYISHQREILQNYFKDMQDEMEKAEPHLPLHLITSIAMECSDKIKKFESNFNRKLNG